MATLTRTVLTCDASDCGDEAPHRHTLQLDKGRLKTLDLCDTHDDEFLAALRRWEPTASPQPVADPAAGRPGLDGEDRAAAAGAPSQRRRGPGAMPDAVAGASKVPESAAPEGTAAPGGARPDAAAAALPAAPQLRCAEARKPTAALSPAPPSGSTVGWGPENTHCLAPGATPAVHEEPAPGAVASAPRPDIEDVFAGLLGEFLDSLGPSTRTAYRRDLGVFTTFLAGRGVEPLTASRRDVHAFIAAGHDRGLSPRTTARRLCAVAGLFRLAELDGLVDRSPMDGVRRPRLAAHQQRRGLDIGEARRLLAGAERHSPRAAVLVGLLLGSGLRIGSVVTADLSGLTRGYGAATLVVRNKGGGRVVTVLSAPVLASLELYLQGRTDGPVLLSARGQAPLRHSGAHRLLKRVTAVALPERPDVSAHTLRAAFCQLAIRAGSSLPATSAALAHVSLATTQPYLGPSLEEHPAHGVIALLQQL